MSEVYQRLEFLSFYNLNNDYGVLPPWKNNFVDFFVVIVVNILYYRLVAVDAKHMQ